MPTESSPPPSDDGAGLSGLAHAESTDEVVARYDGWASDYDDDLDRWGYEVPERLAAELAALVGQAAPLGAPTDGAALEGVVLDAGCGTGRCGVALRAQGFALVHGVDASLASLELAATRGVYDETTQADLTQRLPFDDATFAAVTCAGVLTYLADTEAVLTELLRVVESGGSVLASQRTDLWEERSCADAIAALVAAGLCRAEVSDPLPYLPGHAEYAESILVRQITLTKR